MGLQEIVRTEELAVYGLPRDGGDGVSVRIVTSPGTRRICNDPTCCGVDYTRRLGATCAATLKALGDELSLVESETLVVNILRGGLNFGLREALADAYGWSRHATGFVSAQRAENGDGSGEWHITENAYRKVYFPPCASLVIGDVVATGTSLRYALDELVRTALASGTKLRSIVFFTFGGPKAEEALAAADRACRAHFPEYRGTTLIYLEGVFAVPDDRSPLRIRLPGTDLLRLGAEMAPEFVESQYEDPAYPLERCVIYDAGSRAFWLPDYVHDVIGYWRQNLDLALGGVTYLDLLAERFPSLDASRFGDVDLVSLSRRQLDRMERLCDPIRC